MVSEGKFVQNRTWPSAFPMDVLAVGWFLLSRPAGFIYNVLWSSYGLLSDCWFGGLLMWKSMSHFIWNPYHLDRIWQISMYAAEPCTYMFVLVHRFMNMYVHVHTCIYMYIHMYIQVYTCTWINSFIWNPDTMDENSHFGTYLYVLVWNGMKQYELVWALHTSIY